MSVDNNGPHGPPPKRPHNMVSTPTLGESRARRIGAGKMSECEHNAEDWCQVHKHPQHICELQFRNLQIESLRMALKDKTAECVRIGLSHLDQKNRADHEQAKAFALETHPGYSDGVIALRFANQAVEKKQVEDERDRFKRLHALPGPDIPGIIAKAKAEAWREAAKFQCTYCMSGWQVTFEPWRPGMQKAWCHREGKRLRSCRASAYQDEAEVQAKVSGGG